MNDITELAQSLKAVAHKAKQANDLYLEGKITLSECVIETKDYLDYSDNPNNILALVEALEKAQQRIGELDNDCWTYENTVKNLLKRAGSAESSCSEAARILQSGERMALTRAINILLAAGTKVEAE